MKRKAWLLKLSIVCSACAGEAILAAEPAQTMDANRAKIPTAIVIAQNEDMDFQILFAMENSKAEISSLAPTYALNVCYTGDAGNVAPILDTMVANEPSIAPIQLNQALHVDQLGNTWIDLDVRISGNQGTLAFRWSIYRCQGG